MSDWGPWDYQDNPPWEDKKRRVRERSGGKCEECLVRTADQVHHLQYSPHGIGCEELEWLVHLCVDCHQAKHPYKKIKSAKELQIKAARRARKKRRTENELKRLREEKKAVKLLKRRGYLVIRPDKIRKRDAGNVPGVPGKQQSTA